ncbi:hypothetical protein [Halioxenophilus aromaticivorans]|uniref:V-type ATP synthase subunit E n=1 Tax=Halioxenophilus aromaticivorans TaxID=1306992 RepID=A0AAV3U490_9ALTE
MNKNSEQIAFGIDELVAKLQSEGVEAAEKKSRQILAAAEHEAQQTLAQAKKQSEQLIQQARDNIQRERQAAQEDLQTCYRDMVLDIKNHLLTRFTDDVKRLVHQTVQSDDVVQQLVIAAAGKIIDQANLGNLQALKITLPDKIMQLEDIINDPELGGSGELADFVFSQQHKILREGVTFTRGDAELAGIKIEIKDDKVSVDVTDEAIADMLLTYLNPRFRALLDGIIR